MIDFDNAHVVARTCAGYLKDVGLHINKDLVPFVEALFRHAYLMGDHSRIAKNAVASDSDVNPIIIEAINKIRLESIKLIEDYKQELLDGE